MNNKVVYRHRRLDTFEIFYVGIGSEKRANDKWSRSELWKRTANKAGYEIEILCKNLSIEDACELEMFLIELYGRKNKGTGVLVNLSDGGELNEGVVDSIETRINKSKSAKLKIFTKEHRNNLSKALMNIKRSKDNVEENRKRAIEWHKNNIHTQSKKVECKLTGRTWSSIKICAKETGESYGMLKKKLSGKYKNNTTYKYL